MSLSDRTNFERQLRRRRKRIPPHAHRGRSGVCLLSTKCNRVALHTLGSEHDTKRKSQILEDRPLFNVQFEIRRCVFSFHAGITNLLHVEVATSKSILQTNSIAVCANAIGGDSMRPSERRRSKKTAAKPRALFISPIDQPYRNGWSPMKILSETAHHL